MITKEEGRKNLLEVIERFKRWDKEGRLENEEDVKQLIEELFKKVLGWDIDDIYKERHPGPTSRRVDFKFKIDNTDKLFLEAKDIKVSWAQREFKQAIGYGWGSKLEYVALSNFKRLILFNSKWKDKDKKIFEIENIEECLKHPDVFDRLWHLSKESFLTGEIDRVAKDVGKKLNRIPISSDLTIERHLFNDLKNWRERLSNDIKSFNKSLSEDDRDDIVQKIINRFIFIRVSEDKELEAKPSSTLRFYLEDWKGNKNGKSLLEHLFTIFHEYDKIYDSSIFRKDDLCENVKIHDNVLAEIIEQLYIAEDVGAEYNFESINADILGSVYEDYLNFLLKRKRITENHAHQKEQGIYYTPTHIVDFIVKNTVSETLKDKSISSIRVIDPACGSGSFLIKVFDVISESYKKEEINKEVKNNILTKNIYGVDLDDKAVEIAKLNLFLKIEERERLPDLNNNIKRGNSLIDDEETDKNNAFKWEKKFKEVNQEGGFDVVIGNPPYIAYYSRQKKDLSEKERIYYKNNYEFIDNKEKTGSFNTIMFFIEKGLSILKENGYLGFIIDIGIFENAYKDLRNYILNNSRILKIITDLEEFENVGSGQIILILQKCKDIEKLKRNKIQYQKGILGKAITISQELWMKDIDHKFDYIEKNNSYILENCERNSINLGIYFEVICGLEFGALRDLFISNKKYNNKYHPVINGSKGLPDKYIITWNGEDYVLFDKNYEQKLIRENKNVSETGKNVIFASGNEERFNQQKLFVRQSAMSLIGSYDDSNLYGLRSLHTITKKEKNVPIELKYLLSIINSKLATFYSLKKGIIRYQKGKQPQIRTADLEKFPIKNIPHEKQQPFIDLVDKIISLNKRLNQISDKRKDARTKLEEEINEIAAEIDELVYKLYGITEDEKKIIEESLK
ncbi:MAG: N-6 DNA methylase [Candidatus Aenigmatarchaeota archaeon]